MKLHFTVTSLPEIRALTLKQRLRVLLRLKRKLIRVKSISLALMLLTACLITAIVISLATDDISLSELPLSILIKSLSVAAILGVMWPIFTWYDRKHIKAALWNAHPNGRINYCVECNYDVHMSTNNHCPECGTVIHQMQITESGKNRCVK
jgi:flagellar biosynthesis protein FliP